MKLDIFNPGGIKHRYENLTLSSFQHQLTKALKYRFAGTEIVGVPLSTKMSS